MPEDPMKATEEEIGWAKSIKSLVEANQKLDNLSDLEYLHHAIVAKDNVKKAMKRVERMQAYKKKYGITGGDGDYEQGCKVLQQFMASQPGFITGVGIDTKGRYLCTMEYKMFLPKNVKTEEEWKIMMGSFYYMFQALQPNVAAIREGCVWVCGCKGMGWENFSLEIEKRGAEFYSDAYPMRIKEVAMLDPPRIINAIFKLLKAFLSQKIKDAICMEKMAEYFEERKGVYPKEILPDNMGGTITEKQVLETFETFLKQRSESVAAFKL